MSGTSSERLHYLDSLRGFLMTMGILLHASIIVPDLWFSIGVTYLSNIFRMNLFFFISGFFMALVVYKRGMGSTVSDRIVRIGLPCLIGIAVLNPLTDYFIYITRVEVVDFTTFISPSFTYAAGTPDYINWHLHMWFLLTLVIYSILTPVLFPVSRYLSSMGAVKWMTARNPVTAVFILCLVVTFAFVAARSAHFILFQRFLHGGPFNFPVQATLWYLPYFVLGIMAFMNKDLFKLMHSIRWPHVVFSLVLLVIGTWAYPALDARYGQAVAELVKHLTRGVAGFVLSGLFLSLFKYWLSKPSLVGKLSEASYTVFLFHFLVIAILQYFLVALGLQGHTLYIVSIVVVYAICLAVHFYIIDKIALMALLFNGKPMSRRQALDPKKA